MGKNFSLRSGKEHRSLKFRQLRLEPASGNEPEKLTHLFGKRTTLVDLKIERLSENVSDITQTTNALNVKFIQEIFEKMST